MVLLVNSIIVSAVIYWNEASEAVTEITMGAI